VIHRTITSLPAPKKSPEPRKILRHRSEAIAFCAQAMHENTDDAVRPASLRNGHGSHRGGCPGLRGPRRRGVLHRLLANSRRRSGERTRRTADGGRPCRAVRRSAGRMYGVRECAGSRRENARRSAGENVRRQTSRAVRRILSPGGLAAGRETAIHLGPTLPSASCGLPADSGEQPSNIRAERRSAPS
jgi:hypothetical protein